VIERKALSIKDGKLFSFQPVPAREVVDVSGLYISPGFIESHLHLEGLHLLPAAYSQAFLSHGTTTIITDLHEIANAGGLPGLKWYLRLLEAIPLDVYVMAPSCVPSCRFEKGAGALGVKELAWLKGHKQVIGLGEMMDIDGVLCRRRSVMRKIELFAGKPIDGHAPMLSGETLRSYIAAGIHSDHETTTLEEGREKLAHGMHLFLRQGSVSKDLDALLPLIKEGYLPQLSLCTDDLAVCDLFERGHLDLLVRRLVRSGLPLARALRLATVSPAHYFNLSDRKGLDLGRKADLVIFEDPKDIRVRMTIKNGSVVYRDGKQLHKGHILTKSSPFRMNVARFSVDDLRQEAKGHRIHVIGVREGTLLSEHRVAKARIEDGYLLPDTDRDTSYAYVFDRYRGEKQYGFGFVQGFSLRGGAIGTTYAHDSHNLIIVGDNLTDVFTVLTRLTQENGGMALSRQGKLVEHIPMPFYGIISDGDGHEFMRKEKRTHEALKRMGVKLTNPFFQMSFLSLPVIPALRLTTHGLFDVNRQRHIPVSHD
jgi:adenine deaminase